MPDPVTIEQLRVQVKLDANDASQDDDLAPKLAAAIRAVENRTGRSFGGDEPVIDAKDLPVARMGVLLLAAHWYRNREAVLVNTSGDDLPLAVEFLIAPFSRLFV